MMGRVRRSGLSWNVDILVEIAWWDAEMSFDLSHTALYIENPICSIVMGKKTFFCLFLLKIIFGHVAEAWMPVKKKTAKAF